MNTPTPPPGHIYAGTDPFGKHIFEPCRAVCDTGRMDNQRDLERQMIVGRTLPPTVPSDSGPQFIEGELVSEISSISTSPLSVYVDVIELLDHLDQDEGKLWEFLGKLKDLFA